MTAARTRTPLARYVTAQWWTSSAWTAVDFLRFERRAFERSVLLVRVFYAASMMWALQHAQSWADYANRSAASPLWPAAWWFDRIDVRTGVNVIFTAYLVASALVLVLPERRLARAAYTLALLQYMALVNGFFKINHGLHAWLFVSAVLVLLPDGRWRARTRLADRHHFLSVVWCAQLVVLLFYTLTGVWKLAEAARQLLSGEVSAFHFQGFSLILANELLGSSADTVLGDLLVRYERVGWALFLGTMYLEGFSIVAALRPRLHRIWGIGLILFHVATQLAMVIAFHPNVLILGIFLVNSPFLPERLDVRAVLLDLPGVRFCARVLWPRLARARGGRPVPALQDGARSPRGA